MTDAGVDRGGGEWPLSRRTVQSMFNEGQVSRSLRHRRASVGVGCVEMLSCSVRRDSDCRVEGPEQASERVTTDGQRKRRPRCFVGTLERWTGSKKQKTTQNEGGKGGSEVRYVTSLGNGQVLLWREKRNKRGGQGSGLTGA